MNENRFYILITKSQSDQLSALEQNELADIIASNPELGKEAYFVKDFWDKNEFAYQANGDQVFERISKEINANKKVRSIQMWPRVAAAIALLVLFGATAVLVNQLGLWQGDNLAENQIPNIEKNVPLGKKLRTVLPDGSIVWLNAGSKLIFPKEFAADSRKVELFGEGYFEVEKDKNRPFQVKSNNVVTTALGTSFNINSNRKTNDVQISLATGKVKVVKYRADQSADETYYLTPGQEIVYAEGKSPMVENYEWDEIFGWRDGLIYFKNAGKSEVLKTLEEWYGVDIALEDRNSDQWNVTAKFRSQTLENVLQSISYTVGFEYEIDSRKVLIKFKK